MFKGVKLLVEQRKLVLGWEDLDSMIQALSYHIVNSKRNFSGVYGINNGGYPIAVLVARELELPLVNTPGENTLIVDDVCRTGATLKPYKKSNCAVLFCSWQNAMSGLYFVKQILEPGRVIQFPYGKKESPKI